tara:strand:- start:459 stop:632 length:174 start_codon:yes stop_codon:yes gene_type:complete
MNDFLKKKEKRKQNASMSLTTFVEHIYYYYLLGIFVYIPGTWGPRDFILSYKIYPKT